MSNYPKFQWDYEDDHFRKIAEQQERKRNLLILGIGVVALIWMFSGTLSDFWGKLSWTQQQNLKPLSTPQVIPPRPATSELQFPETGSTILYQQSTGTSAKFTVISEQDRVDNCVVKLETWDSGIPVLALFVRAREQAETQAVPLGDYRVKIACGERWYGVNDMFGRGTEVSIGESPLRFWQSGNTINGNVLSLTKRINGNFRTNSSYLNRF